MWWLVVVRLLERLLPNRLPVSRLVALMLLLLRLLSLPSIGFCIETVVRLVTRLLRTRKELSYRFLPGR
jgi:hypothetical protein